MALIGRMFKKSAWVVRNEEASHSGPGAAHGKTEHSVLDRKTETQHKEDPAKPKKIIDELTLLKRIIAEAKAFSRPDIRERQDDESQSIWH